MLNKLSVLTMMPTSVMGVLSWAVTLEETCAEPLLARSTESVCTNGSNEFFSAFPVKVSIAVSCAEIMNVLKIKVIKRVIVFISKHVWGDSYFVQK